MEHLAEAVSCSHWGVFSASDLDPVPNAPREYSSGRVEYNRFIGKKVWVPGKISTQIETRYHKLNLNWPD